MKEKIAMYDKNMSTFVNTSYRIYSATPIVSSHGPGSA